MAHLRRLHETDKLHLGLCGNLKRWIISLGPFCAAVFPQLSPAGALLGRFQLDGEWECRKT
jgi:hypothetical protein